MRNYPNTIQLGDITKVNEKDIFNQISNLLTEEEQ